MKKLLILSTLTFIFSFFIAAQNISTVAGNHSLGRGYSGDYGPATAAKLDEPTGVLCDASGNLYIVDAGENAIRKVNTSGIITSVVGNSASGYTGDGGPAVYAELSAPKTACFDGSGNLYIADYNNQVIRKVNTSGIITTVAGNNSYGRGYSGDGGPATAAELYDPFGIACDAAGNLYIADDNNDIIRKVNTSGVISTYAGIPTKQGYSGDGGPATAAELYNPDGVVLDPVGNLYISDYNNHVIRKVNTSGTISTVAGNHTYGYSGDGGAATAAELSITIGVSLDIPGNIYISDVTNEVIRKINTSGIISTVAGNGRFGYSGDGGPATAAEIFSPYQVAFDPSGNMYIADYNNEVIRKVAPCNFGTSSAVVIQGILCNGINNGDAQVIISGGTSPFTYSWSNGSTEDSSGAFLGPQTYSVTVHDANGCTTTASVSLTQPPAISLKMDSINGLNCNGFAKVSASGGVSPYSYLWQPGGETGDSILKQCTGTYCCKVTDHNGCVKNICVNLVTTGINQLSTDNGQLTIHPNPSSGVFMLQAKSEEQRGKGMVEIYNVLGEQVYRSGFLIPNSQFQIDLSSQPSGVYLYKVTDKNSTIIGEGKLVIEK